MMTYQNEKAPYNALVKTVITDKNNIKLKDYIPKMGLEAYTVSVHTVWCLHSKSHDFISLSNTFSKNA